MSLDQEDYVQISIVTIKPLAEKNLAKCRNLHITYINLRNAFNSAPLQRLWYALVDPRINNVYINAIKILYSERQAIVEIEIHTSVPFQPTKGVKKIAVSFTLFLMFICMLH